MYTTLCMYCVCRLVLSQDVCSISSSLGWCAASFQQITTDDILSERAAGGQLACPSPLPHTAEAPPPSPTPRTRCNLPVLCVRTYNSLATLRGRLKGWEDTIARSWERLLRHFVKQFPPFSTLAEKFYVILFLGQNQIKIRLLVIMTIPLIRSCHQKKNILIILCR